MNPFNPSIYRGNEKIASDLGIGGGFRRVLLFFQPVTTGLNHNLAAI